MAQMQMARHGTEAGYREELKTDTVCARCRNAHRVFNTQYTKQGKIKGLKYDKFDVIDTLYKPSNRQAHLDRLGDGQDVTGRIPRPPREDDHTDQERTGDGQDDPPSSPGLRERLSDALFTLNTERKTDDGYVPIDEPHEYVHPIESDAESAQLPADDFVISAGNVKAIKDNLGMYLVTAGMTLQLIDPYCGNVLRDNLDDMVDGWARVIMHYPAAAKLFMAKGGGKIMAWLDALMATWPILLALYEHHLAHSVEIDSRGRAVRVRKGESPNGQFATQPDFSQYTVD